MVRQKLDTYYTFKVVSEAGQPLRVRCLKWTEFDDVPTSVYTVNADDKGWNGGCSCPAYTKECKHVKCIAEARADGKINEFYKWRWREKGGWELIDDMLGIDELGERMDDV